MALLSYAQLEDAQQSALADDVAIELERMQHWSLEEAAAYFESGGTVAPAAPPTDDALLALLEREGLSELATTPLGAERLSSLMALERMALLSRLKQLGVERLGARQKLATAIVKASKAAAAAPPPAPAAAVASTSASTTASASAFPPLPRPGAGVEPPMDFGAFDAAQTKLAEGDTHGLVFPFSAEMLRDEDAFGSLWLTKAFRAFGSISADNSVRIESVTGFAGGGAASKALLTVSYAIAEPGLHTRLFVKMPHGQARKREKYLCACILQQDGPEVTFALRYYNRMPVAAPKTYFADRCAATTNFIMIVERLEYASEAMHPKGQPAALPPYALQRAHSKCHDHHLGCERAEYYHVLVAKLGSICGAYKGDASLARALNADFPYPSPGLATAASPELATRQLDQLCEFVCDVAPRLFPADVADRAFMSTFKAQALHMLSPEITGRITSHLSSDPKYIAYCHPNLNVDNAYWWRDEDGALDAGLVDWAGFRCAEVSAHLDLCLFGGEWELLSTHKDELLRTFIGAYAQRGPRLELDELRLRLDLTLALSMGGQAGIAAQLYQRLKRPEWPKIASRLDPRIDGDDDVAFLVRAYWAGLAYRLTRWKRHDVYATVCKWAGCAPAPGTS